MVEWSKRFNGELDECIHLVIALYFSGAFDSQEQDLINNYGNGIVAEAVEIVETQFSSLISRIKL